MLPELGIILLLLLLLLYLGWRHTLLLRKFGDIKSFTDEIARGNTKKRIRDESRGEYAALFDSLNGLAEKFGQQLHLVEESRTRLRITLKSLPEGVVLLDELGYIRLMNPAFQRIFQTEREDYVNTRLVETIRIPELHQLLEGCGEEEELKKAEVFLTEGEIWIEFKVSRIRMDNVRNIGTIVIARDITGEKMAYETRREFVANVSHELKTPITAIRGAAETLLDGAMEEKEIAGNFLRSISNQTKRMEILIKDLITLSKIELGAIPMEKTFISPMPVINEVFDNYREAAEAKGLYLKMNVQDKYLHIEADSDRLFQIVANLVGNGINYTSKGGVTVTVTKEGNGWSLAVEDTGCGIPKKHLARLGERFFRVDPSRSRELGGTGLGLAIVKHLVRSHHWDMTISSEVKKGTRVEIRPSSRI